MTAEPTAVERTSENDVRAKKIEAYGGVGVQFFKTVSILGICAAAALSAFFLAGKTTAANVAVSFPDGGLSLEDLLWRGATAVSVVALAGMTRLYLKERNLNRSLERNLAESTTLNERLVAGLAAGSERRALPPRTKQSADAPHRPPRTER